MSFQTGSVSIVAWNPGLVTANTFQSYLIIHVNQYQSSLGSGLSAFGHGLVLNEVRELMHLQTTSVAEQVITGERTRQGEERQKRRENENKGYNCQSETVFTGCCRLHRACGQQHTVCKEAGGKVWLQRMCCCCLGYLQEQHYKRNAFPRSTQKHAYFAALHD